MRGKRHINCHRRVGFMLGMFVLGGVEWLFWCLAQMPKTTGYVVADIFAAMGIALVMSLLAVAVVAGLSSDEVAAEPDGEASDA